MTSKSQRAAHVEGGLGYTQKIRVINFFTYPGPPEGARPLQNGGSPLLCLPSNWNGLFLTQHEASQRRGRYCSERALQPSRYGQPSRVYAVVSRTANQSKS